MRTLLSRRFPMATKKKSIKKVPPYGHGSKKKK